MNIHSKAECALEVVGLSIHDQQSHHQSRQEERNGFEDLERERHRNLHNPAENDQERSEEESDLQAAADGNTDSQVHLVLVRDDDGSDVLGCVSDNGDENQTDEGLANTGPLDDAVDAVDEVVCTLGNHNCNNDKDDGSSDRAKEGFLFLFVVSFSIERTILDFLEEIRVTSQLEVEVDHVEDEQNDGSSTGKDQDPFLAFGGVFIRALSKKSRWDDQGSRCDRHEGRHG